MGKNTFDTIGFDTTHETPEAVDLLREPESTAYEEALQAQASEAENDIAAQSAQLRASTRRRVARTTTNRAFLEHLRSLRGKAA